MRFIFSISLILGLFAATSVNTAAAADIHSFDVIGIKLGMTPDETKQALTEHNPEFDVQEYYYTYSYSDGTTTYNTDDVLGRMAVRHIRPSGPTPGNETIIIEFSGKAGSEVVTALSRVRSGDLNPPSIKDFAALLVEKYGPFNERNAHFLEWHGDTGSRTCFDLGGLSETSAPLMERAVHTITDFSVCRDTMRYGLATTGPVDSLEKTTPTLGFDVSMVSAKLLIEKYDELNEWVNNLEEDATKKRESTVVKPKL